MTSKRAVLIAGPTASGKSALALELAAANGGTIVNADSMQVYADLRFITARPSVEEEKQAPHRLYGYVDAAERYSVGAWLQQAERTVNEATKSGRPLIFVGGTGLYFNVLLRGLSAIPPIPADVRAAIKQDAEGMETGSLHARLAVKDRRTAAEIRASDRQRILRALEVLEATGRGLADWRDEPGRPVLRAGEYDAVFLHLDRALLGSRIDSRFDKMLAGGALDEVKQLKARKLDPKLSAMKAHGVPWLIKYLDGAMSLEEAAFESKRDTRRYSKRQETWFRNQSPEFEWVEACDALEKLLK